METWTLIEDGFCEGAHNMARDRALLAACGEGPAPVTLRLYGWARPTVTTGYALSPRDVDRDACEALGIPVVARPTGGRSLLHHRELTYSVTGPIPHPCFPARLLGTFQVISEAILHTLALLGVPDARVALPVKGLDRSPQGGKTASCFSSLNHYEIAVDGKKLVGSAQRRTQRAFLQHGSVWIDCDRALVNSLLRFDSETERALHLDLLQRSTVTLNEIRGDNVEFAEVARAFKDGFAEAFGVRWRLDDLHYRPANGLV